MSGIALFEQENGQFNSNESISNSRAIQKKPKLKFTILDDLDQINENINGPGANQQNKKTQQVIQKTYQYMKNHQSVGDDPSYLTKSKQQQSNHFAKKPHQNYTNEVQCKQNTNSINVLNHASIKKLQQKIKRIGGPRIIVTLKQINLQKQPQQHEFFVTGLQKLGLNQGIYGETRAPRNSFQDTDDCQLFTKALLTDRGNKNNGNKLPIKRCI